jgi:hypothetical protein
MLAQSDSPTQSDTEMPVAPTQNTAMPKKANSTAQNIQTSAKKVGKKTTKIVSKSETPLGVKTESDTTSENDTKPDSTPKTIDTKTDSPQEIKTGAKTTKQTGVSKIEEKPIEEPEQVTT